MLGLIRPSLPVLSRVCPAPRRSLRWRDLRLPTRLGVALFALLLTAVCGEVLARGYWTVGRGVSFVHTERVWDSFFPEVAESGVAAAPTRRGDGTFNVLLLGGSVISTGFGDVGARLERGLARRLGRPAHVYNLAYPGRTTLDSLMKYRRLGDKRFDLVVFYHGINDIFLNNCPPEVYRDDYSHAPRYEQLYELEEHRELSVLAAPYTFWYMFNNACDRMKWSNRPRPEWYAFGSDIRTPTAFEGHLEKIIALAGERGDPILLLSFAYDPSAVATDAARVVDPARYAPVSFWGTPENVVRGLDAHNAVIHRVAARHEGVAFVDQQRFMPTGRHYFNDICHLNAEGRAVFVRILLRHMES